MKYHQQGLRNHQINLDKIASRTTKKRREENQKDVKHVLTKIWDSDPDDTLCKILSREAKC